MKPDWIAVDWGTSNLRAWAMGPDGVQAEASAALRVATAGTASSSGRLAGAGDSAAPGGGEMDGMGGMDDMGMGASTLCACGKI